MDEDGRKVCFVVMGFGKKTDYESGRTLDLDATFEGIIKPAAEALSLRCIRADEVLHSGVIDLPMYEMLFRAELVIADISTNNANAIYELGVRHGLRPNATIIMKETGGKFLFDLNHINTFHYEHLGQDIGAREARRATAALRKLIETVLSSKDPDSPVYTFLPKLQYPRYSDEQYEKILDDAETNQEALAYLIKSADTESRSGNHGRAADALRAALDIKPANSYLVQQLALHTYKAKHPSALTALHSAREVIQTLDPENSNDPETLGIAGAIHKRLWLATGIPDDLDSAIRHYRRGYEVRRDYYNGENLATCTVFRARLQESPEEARYDQMTAEKVRKSLVDILMRILASDSFSERSDQRWVYATLANMNYALREGGKGAFYERKFFEQQPAQWEIATYEDGKRAIFSET